MSAPKLRFKEFAGEWERKRLGHYLVEYKKRVSVPTDLPVLTSSRSGLSFQKDYFNDRELQNNGEYGIIPRGYFTYRLMSDDSIFKFNINNLVDVGAISKEYPVFTTKEMNSNFLLQKLNFGNEFKKYAVSQKLGGTRTRLYFRKLIELKINIPTLLEQTKIANFLTAVDEKISQLTQKCDLLKQYKKGIMQQIFSQKLRFKDEDGRKFPGWEEKKLGSIANRVSRKNKENNKNVMTISAQQGLINQEEYFNKSVSAKDVSNYYLLYTGDFAYNRSYSNGYPMGAIKCLNRYEKGVVSTLYICFKFMEGNIISFFEHYFENGFQNSEIKKVAQEGARNHGLLNIGLDDFFNISLIVPSTKEQTKIANFLTTIDDKITQTQTQLDAVKQYKKGLLQQLFV